MDRSQDRVYELMEDWAEKPFLDFDAYRKEMIETLVISKHGIGAIRKQYIDLNRDLERAMEMSNALSDPDQIEVIRSAHREMEESKEDFDMIFAIANREINDEYNTLYSQLVIFLWGGLENLSREIAFSLLANHQKTRQSERLQKIRINLLEYDALNPEDRIWYIIDAVEKDVGSALKQSVAKFESLLEAFGLGGGMDDEARKAIFEMGQVRNALMHRRGIADRKLVNSCPWLGLQVGRRLRITEEMIQRYQQAVYSYVTELKARIESQLKTS